MGGQIAVHIHSGAKHHAVVKAQRRFLNIRHHLIHQLGKSGDNLNRIASGHRMILPVEHLRLRDLAVRNRLFQPAAGDGGKLAHIVDHRRVLGRAPQRRAGLHDLFRPVDQPVDPFVRGFDAVGGAGHRRLYPHKVRRETGHRHAHHLRAVRNPRHLIKRLLHRIFDLRQGTVAGPGQINHGFGGAGNRLRLGAQQRHPVGQRFDIAGDAGGRVPGLLAQRVDRLGHHGKTAPRVARAGGFDLGVDGQRVHLHGNCRDLRVVVLDRIQRFTNRKRAIAQFLHPSGDGGGLRPQTPNGVRRRFDIAHRVAGAAGQRIRRFMHLGIGGFNLGCGMGQGGQSGALFAGLGFDHVQKTGQIDNFIPQFRGARSQTVDLLKFGNFGMCGHHASPVVNHWLAQIGSQVPNAGALRRSWLARPVASPRPWLRCSAESRRGGCDTRGRVPAP